MIKKIAMLGCDSTHTESFTNLMNKPGSVFFEKAHVHSIWGKDYEQAKRKAQILEIKKVAKTVRDAIEGTDLILIVNRFADERYPIARQALQAKKTTFIDKPISMNLKEAKRIMKSYRSAGVSLLSASALRFAADTQAFKKRIRGKKIIGGSIAGPFECTDLGDDSRLKNIFFYGIHVSEILQEIFGPGIRSVFTKRTGPYGDTSIIQYISGLQITMNLLKMKMDYYHLTAYTESKVFEYQVDLAGNYYESTLRYFLDFADAKNEGIPLEHTLEALSLLCSSEKSIRSGKKEILQWKN